MAICSGGDGSGNLVYYARTKVVQFSEVHAYSILKTRIHEGKLAPCLIIRTHLTSIVDDGFLDVQRLLVIVIGPAAAAPPPPPQQHHHSTTTTPHHHLTTTIPPASAAHHHHRRRRRRRRCRRNTNTTSTSSSSTTTNNSKKSTSNSNNKSTPSKDLPTKMEHHGAIFRFHVSLERGKEQNTCGAAGPKVISCSV